MQEKRGLFCRRFRAAGVLNITCLHASSADRKQK